MKNNKTTTTTPVYKTMQNIAQRRILMNNSPRTRVEFDSADYFMEHANPSHGHENEDHERPDLTKELINHISSIRKVSLTEEELKYIAWGTACFKKNERKLIVFWKGTFFWYVDFLFRKLENLHLELDRVPMLFLCQNYAFLMEIECINFMCFSFMRGNQNVYIFLYNLCLLCFLYICIAISEQTHLYI